ncbi:RluA family pseudouridine synthase [Aliikangiella maris]|uniref:RNA pseudouridine synthase n=2 Tax=Aliikangiella maris TaxID=3162458 RepID=A0ABV3MU22_9GAMM
MESERFEKHWVLAHEQQAIDVLANNLPQISRQKLKLAMQYGACWVTNGRMTQRVRRAKKVLPAGSEVHLYFDTAILFLSVPPAKLLSDEAAYSVWIKPAGMFSQGTKWGDHSAISRWVELNEFPERQSFLVHRLDRATSGLIILAHQKNIARQLAHAFEQRQVEKHYLANVAGLWPESLITLDSPLDNKPALTRVLQIKHDYSKQQTWLRLQIETGRKHQIRQHLFAAGFPIIGDRLYQSQMPVANVKDDSESLDLQLRSVYLRFTCPVSGEVKTFDIS